MTNNKPNFPKASKKLITQANKDGKKLYQEVMRAAEVLADGNDNVRCYILASVFTEAIRSMTDFGWTIEEIADGIALAANQS